MFVFLFFKLVVVWHIKIILGYAGAVKIKAYGCNPRQPCHAM